MELRKKFVTDIQAYLDNFPSIRGSLTRVMSDKALSYESGSKLSMKSEWTKTLETASNEPAGSQTGSIKESRREKRRISVKKGDKDQINNDSQERCQVKVMKDKLLKDKNIENRSTGSKSSERKVSKIKDVETKDANTKTDRSKPFEVYITELQHRENSECSKSSGKPKLHREKSIESKTYKKGKDHRRQIELKTKNQNFLNPNYDEFSDATPTKSYTSVSYDYNTTPYESNWIIGKKKDLF